MDLRLSSFTGGGRLHVEFDGVDVSGPVPLPHTGDWRRWQTVTVPGVPLRAGRQAMRVVFDKADATGFVCDRNWVELRAAAK